MQTDTLTRWLAGISEARWRDYLLNIFRPLVDRQSTLALSSAGLAIKSGGSAIVKTGGSATIAMANGVLRSIAASTDMAALVGSVTNAKFNVFCFFVDSGGNLTTLMGTEGATLAAVKFPQLPIQKAILGFVIINPTGTGPFVGGTTPLDDGTVVPNAVYVNTPTGFDPANLIGGA